MADTLTTQIAETVQEIITATVELIPQKAPMPNLCTRYNIPKGHDRVEIPRVNATFSVQTPTEGDELSTGQAFDLTSTTIQPTRRAIIVRVDERPTYFSKEDIIKLVSNEISRAQAQDIDTDLTAEFSNMGLTAGSSNTDLTIAALRTAMRKLQSNTVANGGPAPTPLMFVGSPLVMEDLMTNIGLQGVVASTSPWIPDGLSADVLKNYHVPQNHLVGIDLFWDGYMTEDGSGDFICGMYAKELLWLAISKDWDMKTFEVPQFIGTYIRTVADYNSGLSSFTNWGVKVTADGV